MSADKGEERLMRNVLPHWHRRSIAMGLGMLIGAVIAIACLTRPAKAERGTQAQIIGNEVNMRSAPSQDAAVLQQLSIGTMVTIVEQGSDGWSLIRYNETEGYIRTDLLFMRALKGRLAYVQEDGGNMRGGPSTSAYVLAKLEAGQPVTVEQLVGDWYYVSYEGQEGFVHRDLLLLTSREASSDAAALYKFGMEGDEVSRIQKELSRRNFIEEKYVTGHFGSLTREAVKDFQSAAGIDSDGVVSEETIAYLYDTSNSIKKAPKVPTKVSDFRGLVIQYTWRNRGESVLRRPGGTATLYDVGSGKSFKIRRTGGTNHIDGTPMTAADTAIMKDIFGGRWTHERRAVIMKVGNYYYAASLYGMPHGGDVQKGDNYPGMLCIHLTGSRTHGGGSVDSGHQSNIRYIMRKYGKE